MYRALHRNLRQCCHTDKQLLLTAKANYIEADAALAAEVAATIKASRNAWLNGDGNIGNGVGGHPGLHRIQVTWT